MRLETTFHECCRMNPAFRAVSDFFDSFTVSVLQISRFPGERLLVVGGVLKNM